MPKFTPSWAGFARRLAKIVSDQLHRYEELRVPPPVARGSQIRLGCAKADLMSSPQQRPLMPPARFTARYVESLALVGAEAWDACANPAGLPEAEAAGERHNPFVSHAFLLALEQSKSVGARTGWSPLRMSLVEDEAGRLVAAGADIPEVSQHGRRYVFDHSWAQAYEQRRRALVLSEDSGRRAPFTPVHGPGYACWSPADAPEGARDALIAALRGLRKATRRLFDPRHFRHRARYAGPDPRRLRIARRRASSTSSTKGYADFDAFLAALVLAQAQDDQARVQARCAGGDDVYDRPLDRRSRHKTQALGLVLRLLPHGHRLAQMGPPLS